MPVDRHTGFYNSMAGMWHPRWTPQEDADLIRLFVDDDLDGPDLMAAHCSLGWRRSMGAIDQHLHVLGALDFKTDGERRKIRKETDRRRIVAERLADDELKRQVHAAQVERPTAKPFQLPLAEYPRPKRGR